MWWIFHDYQVAQERFKTVFAVTWIVTKDQMEPFKSYLFIVEIKITGNNGILSDLLQISVIIYEYFL